MLYYRTSYRMAAACCSKCSNRSTYDPGRGRSIAPPSAFLALRARYPSRGPALNLAMNHGRYFAMESWLPTSTRGKEPMALATTSLKLDTRRIQTAAALRQRWPRPSADGAHVSIPKDHVESTARAVLDTMLTRQFRNGRFPEQDNYIRQLKCVRHWVRRGRPIRVNVGYAPMKNPNAARFSRADWAEFFALGHLCSWHNKVQAVYPPGLSIKIVFDDTAVGLANGADRQHMDSYIHSVGALVS